LFRPVSYHQVFVAAAYLSIFALLEKNRQFFPVACLVLHVFSVLTPQRVFYVDSLSFHLRRMSVLFIQWRCLNYYLVIDRLSVYIEV
jgi:hypothetical protein